MYMTVRRYPKVEGDKPKLVDTVNREFVALIS